MSAESYEDAERTRRIQEEIRRKIAERRGGRVPPVLPSAPLQRPAANPTLAPRPVAPQGGGLRERLQRKLAELQQQAEAVATARQERERAEALRRQEAADRAAAEQRALSVMAARDVAPPKLPSETTLALPVPALNPWRMALRDPANLRRAIVLREIIGPPVGLR